MSDPLTKEERDQRLMRLYDDTGNDANALLIVDELIVHMDASEAKIAEVEREREAWDSTLGGALEDVRQLRAEIARLKREREELVRDNRRLSHCAMCVYCGQEFGPFESAAIKFAAMTEHILNKCEGNPWRELQSENERLREALRENVIHATWCAVCGARFINDTEIHVPGCLAAPKPEQKGDQR